MAGSVDPVPKPLVHVRGAPLIERVLSRLGPFVSRACIVIPPDDRRIPAALGGEVAGVSLTYAIQEEQLGVGHAVLQAASATRGSVLVVMGDAYYRESIGPFVDAWRTAGGDGAVLVEGADDDPGGRMGRVRIADGLVVELEKTTPSPRLTHRVAGAFVLPRSAFRALERSAPGPAGEVEIESAVTALIGSGCVFRAVPYGSWRRNVNTPADLAWIEDRLRSEERDVAKDAGERDVAEDAGERIS